MINTEKLYNQLCELQSQYPEPLFFKTEHNVQGYKAHIFVYKLARYDTMSKNVLLSEMRGITFLINKDGSLFKHYLSLHKFYNVNENESTLLSKLQEKKLTAVYEKEDGSLITFVDLPNKNIVAKTKGSFDNEECKVMQKYYDSNVVLQNFVEVCLKNNLQPFFEYTSPMNKIVLDYPVTECRLLCIRDNSTFEYKNIDFVMKEYNTYYDLLPKKVNLTLSEVLEICKTKEDFEGYVLQFGNDFAKSKCDWYFRMHRMTFDTLTKENDIIQLYFDEKLDDAVSMLDESMVVKRQFIKDVVLNIENAFKTLYNDAEELKRKFNGSIKDFAISYKKEETFDAAIRSMRENTDCSEGVKNYILKKTKRYNEAKEFLKKYKTI